MCGFLLICEDGEFYFESEDEAYEFGFKYYPDCFSIEPVYD